MRHRLNGSFFEPGDAMALIALIEESAGNMSLHTELGTHVNNLVVGSYCNSTELQKRIKPGCCLIICDIEGDEAKLLDPLKVPALKSADILVEVHAIPKMSVAEVRDLLKDRFQGTHDIEIVDSRSREIADARQLLQLKMTDEELLLTLDEGRNGPQCWLWLRQIRPAP